MEINKRIQKLLVTSGLTEDEAELYIYVLQNEGCSVMDAIRDSAIPKTTAYRVFDELINKGLICSKGNLWKNLLLPMPIDAYIKRLDNEQKNRSRLMHELKVLFSMKKMPETDYSVPQIEVFRGDESLQKYLDLSEMHWSTNVSFGNWEDLNKNGHLIPLEKKFIRNRLKKGANAISYLMKGGQCTSEITDFDEFEDRKTKTANNGAYKPMWVNAFEGNNYVYIWTLNNKHELIGTFIDSEPVADFYKNHVYSLLA